MILKITVVQNLTLNYPARSLNNVLVNFEIIIVRVTIFIVNCCVCDDALYIVVNCGLLRNILVKLVKFLFCFLIATIFGE